MKTNSNNQFDILAQFWIEERDQDEYGDFFELNDLGPSLAYFISNGIVPSTPVAEDIVQETFDALLDQLGVEDSGFNSLSEIMQKFLHAN